MTVVWNLRALRLAIALSVGIVAATPGHAADTITVITTGKASAVEWPLYIAIAKGFFAEHGLTIDTASSPSTSAAMQQVTAGAGDIASGGLTDPIRAIDHGADLSVLMLETSVPPYSLWGKPALHTVGDLRGKLVIVGGAKDITRLYLERLTGPNGLQPSDYDLTYAGTTPARYAALAAGAVDAAVLYPPASFKAAAAGYSKLGEMSDYVKDLPFSGYVVNIGWAMAHKAAVTGFVRSINQGVTWFYVSSHRAEAVDLMIRLSGGDRGDVEKTYDYFQAIHIFPNQVTLTPAMLAPLIKLLSDAHDLDGATDPKRFIDPAIQHLVDQAD